MIVLCTSWTEAVVRIGIWQFARYEIPTHGVLVIVVVFSQIDINVDSLGSSRRVTQGHLLIIGSKRWC